MNLDFEIDNIRFNAKASVVIYNKCTSQEKVDNLCKKEGDWFDKLILFIIIIIFKLNRSKIF